VNFIGQYYQWYLALGFSVIPIKTLAYATNAPGSDKEAKQPLIKWERFQTELPTPTEIERWSTQWPSAGIAVVCGLLSDVMVFDDDLFSRIPLLASERGEVAEREYQVLLQNYGSHEKLVDVYNAGDELHAALMEIATARARSSRGRHFYFRMPRNADGIPVTTGNRIGFLPKWDIRAEGGYVILPPTIHPSGTSYVWENRPENGIELPPAWLLETMSRIVAPVQSSPVTGTKSSWRINVPVPEGHRNDELARWIGGQVGYGGLFHDELSWPILKEAVLGHNLAYNVPPLDQDEVLTTLDSICNAERTKRKTNNSALNQPYAFGSEVELLTAAELGILDLHAPDYAIKDFIVDGTTQLFGKPKSGKSWFSYQTAAAVGLGHSLFPSTASMYAFADHPQGFSAHQGDVLYLALEDGWLRLQTRGLEIFGTINRDKWPASITFATQWEPCFDGGLVRIERWLNEHPNARLVVIDTIAAFMGEIPQSRGSVFRAEYRMFRPIWELFQHRKIPCLVVDHASKGKGKTGTTDPYDAGAGTLGSQAAVDSVMTLQHDEKGPYARIYHKGRDIERGFLDLEHTKTSPLWKIRTSFNGAMEEKPK
jgi:hypothetical protein